MPLFNPQEEQFERRANVGRWQIVRVHFENPDEDTVIPHQLPTPVPEQISYQLLNCTGPAVLYHDGTPTRRPWGKGYIILRSNIAPVTCDVLLTISAAPIGTTTLPQGAFTIPGIDADTLDGLDSTAFARSNGTYVTTSAEAGLVNSFNLGGLSSGLLKHTVTGGNSTPATATAGTDYVAPGAVTTSGLTMTATRLLGRSTASTGAIEEIQVGSGLNLSAGVLSASGGAGGGNATESTDIGSETLTTEGDLNLYANAPYIARYDGSAWAPWGPLWRMTPPVLADFSWDNQGSATTDTTHGIVTINAPISTAHHHVLYKTAPTPPYNIIVAYTYRSAGFGQAGIGFRDSTTGKLALYTLLASGTFESSKWNSASVFNGLYTSIGSVGPATLHKPIIWFRFGDDNTNRVCSISSDGYNWTQLHSVSRTDFLTPDQICFSISTENASAAYISVFHWEEET